MQLQLFLQEPPLCPVDYSMGAQPAVYVDMENP